MKLALIFDLDGTLVDSEKAIYKCFQNITNKIAPNRIEYARKILIGPPLRHTASEILGPEHQNLLDEFVQSFIAMHDDQVIKHTKPYPDVAQVLKQIHAQKIPMALATNKRLNPTKKLINHFEWNDYFMTIECSDSKYKLRDKKEMITDIFNFDKKFKDSIFVGDTTNDGKSSNEKKIKFIRANYGYGCKENWSEVKIYDQIDCFRDILPLIRDLIIK